MNIDLYLKSPAILRGYALGRRLAAEDADSLEEQRRHLTLEALYLAMAKGE